MFKIFSTLYRLSDSHNRPDLLYCNAFMNYKIVPIHLPSSDFLCHRKGQKYRSNAAEIYYEPRMLTSVESFSVHQYAPWTKRIHDGIAYLHNKNLDREGVMSENVLI